MYLSQSATRIAKANIPRGQFSQWVENKLLTEFGEEATIKGIDKRLNELKEEIEALSGLKDSIASERDELEAFIKNMVSHIKNPDKPTIKSAASALAAYQLVIRDSKVLSQYSFAELTQLIAEAM